MTLCASLITVPLMLKHGHQRKIYRILIGLLLAAVLSACLLVIGYSILRCKGPGRAM